MWLKLLISASLICIVLQAEPFAQQGARVRRGKIFGVVLDRNDARVVGATVTFWNPKYDRRVITDDVGQFQAELPSGNYTIEVEKAGFNKFEIYDFNVKARVTEVINIHLEIAGVNCPGEA